MLLVYLFQAAFSLSLPSNGTYKEGDNLDFTLTHPKSITVDTTGGTPSFNIDVGGTDVWNVQTVDLCNAGYNTGNARIRFRVVMPSIAICHQDMVLIVVFLLF